jgi:sn1-specific diacylglycerol lipase
MVMLDKKSQTVIISIRGTSGFADLVTDLLSKSVDVASIIPEWVFERLPKNKDGSPKQCFGHAGILSSSKAILKDLEDNGLIRAMLDINMSSSKSHKESMHPDPELSRSIHSDVNTSFSLSRAQSMVSEAVAGQGWGVVVTGHSLGAAVATMISFKLRAYFSTLRCYAFNPPGGIISPELSELARDFCTSVVVGYDAISRLSLQTVQELIDDMVSSLCRCKRPKLTILIDHLLGRRKHPSMAPKTFGKFESLSPEIKAILEQYLAQSQLHQEKLEETPLCPGGTVILMRPYSVRKDVVRQCRKDKISFEEIWEAVYIDSDEVLNEGLVLTGSSIGHHRVSVLQDSLESALKIRNE